MIVEGIITTLDADGGPHITPMGPEFSETEPETVILKPFQTSSTFRNLTLKGQAVFHLVDDPLMLARASCGLPYLGQPRQSESGNGWILPDACKAFELEVIAIDDSQDRARIPAKIVRAHTLKDFGGWNRAHFAVLEGAILLSRVTMLGLSRVNEELDRLEILVKKTAGSKEWEAWRLLRETVQMRGEQS